MHKAFKVILSILNKYSEQKGEFMNNISFYALEVGLKRKKMTVNFLLELGKTELTQALELPLYKPAN